jgi:peptidoglycan/xylan/chitin deacetylase (PgdA/CDA1 family)
MRDFIKITPLSIFMIMISFNTYSSENIRYANIYADQLISDFDNLLDQSLPGTNILTHPIYAKIQAARSYIEKSGNEPTKYGQLGIIAITDIEKYRSVVSEIDTQAMNMLIYQRDIFRTEKLPPVLYPSIGHTGNVTGNTYPKNAWSLTFDDGPRKGRTEKVIENLYLYNMQASFFVLMREINKFPSSLRRILDNNMELSLHSYTHKDLNKADTETLEYEVSKSLTELKSLSQNDIRLFRLPYGSGMRNKVLRTKIADDDLIHIFWNVDTLDWKDSDPQSIFNRTIKQMKNTPNNSGIILFHDIHAQTVVASEMVMKYLHENNKIVCTVGEVINYHNGEPQACL